MSVTINESGLEFGEYEKSKLFYAEQSSLYMSLGENIRTIEFVLFRNDEILFIEAKSSSPTPSNTIDFDGFIDDVYRKFYHSIDMYFSIVIGRLNDVNKEMPSCFKAANYSSIRIKLLLIINGHDIGWLDPINIALTRKLRMQIKTWHVEVVVMNHDLARSFGLLKH